jgi:2-polyprenyl-3-methyl-5-hydroxy-6-metoxy-1,4-benzoquinol methylase
VLAVKDSDFLPEVKQQYEDLPYPPRNPVEENYRILRTVGDNLLTVNHHCYQGRRDFRSGFRCLVAGGGTGDSLIYLAEQLRDFDAEIVYLDMSKASRAVAEARAKVRGLTNITWITDSIMEIPRLDLGEFDFINSIGVLHHLESTEAGLQALASVLKPEGAMHIMLYAKYGRRAVYDMQTLLRAYLPQTESSTEKIVLARQLLDNLPATNSFRRDFDAWKNEISSAGLGDSGLFDLLLHTQDRCFDVDEVYQLAASADLRLLNFVDQATLYDPLTLVNDEQVKSRLAAMDLPRRQAVAEQLGCSIIKHAFYLGSKDNKAANLNDENNCLYLHKSMYQQHRVVSEKMLVGQAMTMRDAGQTVTLHGSLIAKALILNMDGKTPLKRIFKRVKKAVPGVKLAQIKNELALIYQELHPKGYLYLIEEGSFGVKVPDSAQIK